MSEEREFDGCGAFGGSSASGRPDGGPGAGGPWVETFMGRKFYLLEPRAEDVDARDIAHALGQICRFGGHTRRFYSVAEHSIHVSRLCDPGDALAGLLHDAAEAYIGDVTRPMKNALPGVREMEEKIRRVIFEAFGLKAEMPESVKRADLEMLWAEKKELMGTAKWDEFPPGTRKRAVRIAGFGPTGAGNEFRGRLKELGKGTLQVAGYGWEV